MRQSENDGGGEEGKKDVKRGGRREERVEGEEKDSYHDHTDQVEMLCRLPPEAILNGGNGL